MIATDHDNDAELRQRARQRAAAKLSFYRHVAIYLTVNVFLLALDLLTSPGALWFYWPLLGWGAAVAIHGCNAFVADIGGPLSRRLEERELEKLRQERR